MPMSFEDHANARIDEEMRRRQSERPQNFAGHERRGTRSHARANGAADEAEPASEPAPRRVLDWDALSATNPPARQWAIEHWLPFAPTLVAGPGGVGKSLLLQTIGTALSNATPYVDRIPRPLRVLMWACEDEHDELWRRQIAICAAFGVELASLVGRFDLESRVGKDNTLFTLDFNRPVWTSRSVELREQVNDLRADVLILDNVRQVYGANEVDPHCVSVFVNGLMALRTDAPFVPILTGHTARAQGSEYAGTAQWENAVRARWYFGAQLPDRKVDEDDAADVPDTSIRYLAKRKANYSALDYRLLNYIEGALRCDQPDIGGPGVMAGLEAGRADRVVLEGFDELTRMNVPATDGTTSPQFLPKLICKRNLAQGVSRKDLERALYRLLETGALARRVIGKYPNRTDRFGLVRP